MNHAATVQYRESYLPPRCRLPRERDAQIETTLELYTLDEQADPVVAHVQHFARISHWQDSELERRVPYRRGQDGRWWTQPEPRYDGTVQTVQEVINNVSQQRHAQAAGPEHAVTLAQLALNDRAEDRDGALWIQVPHEPYYTTEVRHGWSEVRVSHWDQALPGQRTVGATEEGEHGLSGFDLAVHRATSEHLGVYARILVQDPAAFTHHVALPRTVRVQVTLDLTLDLAAARSARDAQEQIQGQLGTLLGQTGSTEALNTATALNVHEF